MPAPASSEAVREGEALFTDLYELTMLQAYFNEGMDGEAVFDLYVRSLPPQRNFLIACGLEQVLAYLEELHFSREALEHLDSLKLFTAPFLDYLSRLRFTGDVYAVPEGCAVFGQEPILELSAPIPQAQLVETYLLNQITFQTLIASKGARTVIAADGRTLVDFGSRRAHGSDAALKAARALHIAGYDSTSNVLAGRMFGIPVAGTMAHSYIQAHENDLDAFRAFVRSYPETVLLVDTYDTMEGVRAVARLAGEMREVLIRAVRLDSGDLVQLSKEARLILDGAGLASVGIFASGGMDEYEIARLLRAGAPIDAFGVGTSAVVSNDAPALDSAYKLVSYDGRPKVKLSPEKATLPGMKQVYRREKAGVMEGDVIALHEEPVEGEPLLLQVMKGGKRTPAGRATLEDARLRTREQLQRLPERLRSLERAEPYPVELSPALRAEAERLRRAATSR